MPVTIRCSRLNCPPSRRLTPQQPHHPGRIPIPNHRTLTTTPQPNQKSTSQTLPSTPARTRFAPSPTGYLHLGSLRTALFNYLLARKTHGQFLLRIEDTDSKRTVPGAEARLIRDLQWAGLHWDEGPGVGVKNGDPTGGPRGPYRQSERTQIYRSHAEELVREGHAYRCFCSAERLDELSRRRRILGLPTDYDRSCASLSSDESADRASRGEKHVVRLLAPESYPEYHDLVYGRVGGGGKRGALGVKFKAGEETYEDPVLLKSDGSPTYHLANVVDDHLMEITHVVRATEWMPSTPKHLALYRAFGWVPPRFAHVGLLMNSRGEKLSKRNMETDISVYREEFGILPGAMVNFVALLGWSHNGGSDDLGGMRRLLEAFEMRFTRGNATVDPGKLWFLQRAHAARAITSGDADGQEIIKRVTEAARQKYGEGSVPTSLTFEDYVAKIMQADTHYETTKQYVDRIWYFFREFEVTESPLLKRHDLYQAAVNILDGCSGQFVASNITAQIKSEVARLAESAAEGDAPAASEDQSKSSRKQHDKAANTNLLHYLRQALVAGERGPAMAMTMEILGLETCRRRLERCGKAVGLG